MCISYGRRPQCLNDLYVGSLSLRDGVYSSLQDDVVGLRRFATFNSANGEFSARLMRFGHRNCLDGTICCRMMYLHLNLVQEMDIWVDYPNLSMDIWVDYPNLSLAFDAVITGRDDVVHYYGVRDSSRTTTVLFW